MSAALPARFNFAQYLLDKNTCHADRIAYIDDCTTLTYGALEHGIRCVAAGLLASGLQPGERMLLILYDDVDFPLAFLGALFAGIVPVPVNTFLPAADYAYLIEHSDAKCIVMASALLPILLPVLMPVMDQALSCSASTPQLIVTGAAAPPGMSSFKQLQHAQPLQMSADTGSAQCAFWLYSSGSTGRPKATVHAHGSLYWTAELYAKPILGLHADDVVLSAAKLFFAYGLGNALSFPLSVGATVILMAERTTSQAICQRLTRYQPTVFFGIPTLYVAMLASATLPRRKEVALRVCVSAGEALPSDTGKRFREHFACDILDGLGSTEMLHIYLSNRPDAIRYGTTGQPVPGYDIALRNEDNLAVGVGEVGELYVRGPSAALMYWSDQQQTRATFNEGWVRTGDNYQVDADGYYQCAGRNDDMLKVSGQYVSPLEVEHTLMLHQGVLECAVVSKTDSDGLTKTAAYVVRRDEQADMPQLSDELKIFIKGKLAPHKYPRDIIFVDALPKTATGKIQRFKLRS